MIMVKQNAFKPAVTKSVLLLLAGTAWLCVGTFLLSLARSWLSNETGASQLFLGGLGVTMALLVHHFGFLRIVDKNIARILPMVDKKCLFSFITWKSYLLISGMIAMGTLLRHSPLPKPFLAVPYTAIGLALILSSLRYFRVFIKQVRKA